MGLSSCFSMRSSSWEALWSLTTTLLFSTGLSYALPNSFSTLLSGLGAKATAHFSILAIADASADA